MSSNIVYGPGGLVSAAPGVVKGRGVPPVSFIGKLGQLFIDESTTPPTTYVFNGQTWALVAVNDADLETLSGDTGVAVPTSNNINIVGSGDITTAASGSTVTISYSAGTSGIDTINGNTGSVTPTGGTVTISGAVNTLLATGSGSTLSLAFAPQLQGPCIQSLGSTRNITSLGVGSFAGITGDDVAAFGTNALASNTSNQATACGARALLSHTSGSNVAAFGYNAGATNTTGNNLTAIGWAALQAASTGDNNTAVGASAASSVTTGSSTVALGFGALSLVTTGTDNVGIGVLSGSNYTGAESNNILLGNAIGGTVGENNAMRLGNGATAKTYVTGVRGVTTDINDAVPVLVDSGNQLGVTSSSLRYKENVKNMEGSDRIYSLRPVSFKYKSHEDGLRPQYGLIAEEVQEVIPEMVVLNKEGLPDTLQYQNLPIFLLAEIQKLKKEIEELKKRI